jgi:hypothetical protein
MTNARQKVIKYQLKISLDYYYNLCYCNKLGYFIIMKVTKSIPDAVAKLSGVGMTAAVKVDPDERLFAHFFGCAVQGLLACNVHMGQMELEDYHEPDDLIERARWYAEMMVEVVHDRREVQKFESKLED